MGTATLKPVCFVVGETEPDFCADAVRNRLDNGKAQARPDVLATESAIEGIKDPAPFAWSDARSVVLDVQHDASLRVAHRKIDPTALRGISNGVIDQVFDHGDHV